MDIIIVDDEQLIRQWFIFSIENSSNNYRIVGEASNGREALAILEKVKADVVITDIEMPIMDGLTLMTCANEKYSGIDWMILTCHAEFEYARKAISQGAFEYLLKSEISDEEIIDKLKRLETHRKKSQLQSGHIQYEQEKFIRDLLNNDIDESQIKTTTNHCELQLSGSNLIAITIECDYRLKNKVVEQWQPINHYYHQIHWIRYKEKYLVIVALKEDVSQLNTYNNMKAFIMKFYQITGASLGISRIHHCIEELKTMCQTSIQAYEQRFYERQLTKIYYYEELVDQNHFANLKAIKEDIIDYLNKKTFDELEEKIDGFLHKIGTKRILNIDWIYEAVQEIFEKIYFLYSDMLKVDNIDYNYIINNVYRYQYYEDLKNCCKNILNQLTQIIQRQKYNYSKPIQEAIKYIETHYHENISLQIVAKEIYLNPNYLSQLFKKNTHLKFNQYVTNLRMEKAKELLEQTNMKIYEIGLKVGYTNVSHFARTFKKHEGISAYEYRSSR